jgi:FkbM family methyltransferase
MTDLSATINRTAFRLATRVYRATPFQPLREAYFRMFLRLVRGRRVIRVVEGMTFELDLGELIDVGVFLERYERDMVVLIERLTQPAWTVLDIGANIGAHTLRFAKLVGGAGRVFAFEPTDYAYHKLTRNLSLNRFPQASAVQVALGEKNDAARNVTFRSSWRSDGRDSTQQTTVDFARLDDWCREHGVARVDLIKLDVDGNEFPVLAGGLEMLQANHPVVLMEAGAYHFRDPARNPLAVLRNFEYRFWDTKTLQEYPNLDAIRRQLPERDDDLGFSINVLAMTALLPPLGPRPG